MTYELIETVEVGAGGAASIEFTSIPQDGFDLKCVLSGRLDASSSFGIVQVNNDTTNYNSVRLQNAGTSVISGLTSPDILISINPSSFIANSFGYQEIYIGDYATNSQKIISSDGVAVTDGLGSIRYGAGRYFSTSAVTTIKLFQSSGNFVQYSTASLYKIY